MTLQEQPQTGRYPCNPVFVVVEQPKGRLLPHRAVRTAGSAVLWRPSFLGCLVSGLAALGHNMRCAAEGHKAYALLCFGGYESGKEGVPVPHGAALLRPWTPPLSKQQLCQPGAWTAYMLLDAGLSGL